MRERDHARVNIVLGAIMILDSAIEALRELPPGAIAVEDVYDFQLTAQDFIQAAQTILPEEASA